MKAKSTYLRTEGELKAVVYRDSSHIKTFATVTFNVCIPWIWHADLFSNSGVFLCYSCKGAHDMCQNWGEIGLHFQNSVYIIITLSLIHWLINIRMSRPRDSILYASHICWLIGLNSERASYFGKNDQMLLLWSSIHAQPLTTPNWFSVSLQSPSLLLMLRLILLRLLTLNTPSLPPTPPIPQTPPLIFAL